MSNDPGKNIPYSFGETPSDRIRRVDHQSWWDIFMDLVGAQPERPEFMRLSDDPVHIIHGQCFSIRDCAKKAIEAAYKAGEESTAQSYKERAEKLVRSYDRLAISHIRRFYDRRFTRSLVASLSSLLLGVVVASLYFLKGQSSTGLLVILFLFVTTSLACAVFAAYTMRKKRSLLRLDQTLEPKPQELR